MSEAFSAEWISAEEDRPEMGQSCLMWKNGDIYKRVYNANHNCWDDEDGDDYFCDYEEVEYWMRLPKPPSSFSLYKKSRREDV